MTRMTQEEFNAKQEELLKDVHPKLASVLSYKAYEDGHYAGREEVIVHLRNLVHEFREINELLKLGLH
jgi:hypothetical protein